MKTKKEAPEAGPQGPEKPIAIDELSSIREELPEERASTAQTKIHAKDLDDEDPPAAKNDAPSSKEKTIRLENLDQRPPTERPGPPQTQIPLPPHKDFKGRFFDIKVSRLPPFIIIGLLIVPNLFSHKLSEFFGPANGDAFNTVPIMVTDFIQSAVKLYLILTPILCFLVFHYYPMRSMYFVECTKDSLRAFLILESTGEVRRVEERWSRLAGVRKVNLNSLPLLEFLNEHGHPQIHVRMDMIGWAEFKTVLLERPNLAAALKNQLAKV